MHHLALRHCTYNQSVILKKSVIQKFFWICATTNLCHSVTQKTTKCFFVVWKYTIIPQNTHILSQYHLLKQKNEAKGNWHTNQHTWSPFKRVSLRNAKVWYHSIIYITLLIFTTDWFILVLVLPNYCMMLSLSKK